MKLLQFLRNHSHELFYGLIMAFGIVSLQIISKSYSYPFQFLAIFFNLFILLIGIYVSYKQADKQLTQLDLPSVDNLSQGMRLILHIIFPSIFWLSFSHFVIFNNYPWLTLVYFISVLVITSVFLMNIKSYYLDKFKLVEDTNYIYEVARILTFFSIINIVMNLGTLLAVNIFLIGIAVTLFSAGLIFTVLIRRINVNYFDILLILLAGLALGLLLVGIYSYLVTTTLLVAFFLTLCFYILTAVIIHEIDNTLKLSTVVEYILVALITLLILLLIK
jgi:hypothetical protein